MTRAAARLRGAKQWTTGVWLHVQFGDQLWEARARCVETQATSALLKILAELWESFPPGQPTWVSVAFHPLIPDARHTLTLFDDPRPQIVSDLMDAINARYGAETVYPASVMESRGRTSPRIAFSRIPGAAEWGKGG